MKSAYIFPGQGAQFEGMGKDLYERSDLAKALFEQANEVLGFRITDVMFEGTAEELKATKITQPAVFLHSIVTARLAGDDFKPWAVAGHSLGEFSALVAAGAMDFAEGLSLVHKRALAMQKACEATESTMAAILGLEDSVVEEVCAGITDQIVVAANYNCPGQLVISGSVPGIEAAVAQLTERGAKRALILPVGGAFHSPLMEPAKQELAAAIASAKLTEPRCPVYQNVDAQPTTDVETIRQKLIDQLTGPVRWTQTIQNMIADGVENFVEVGGNGKTLRGMVRKIDRNLPSEAL